MAAKDTITPGWFSIEGAAIYTGFSVPSIRAAMENKKFPARRVPVTKSDAESKSVRIKRDHLDAWIEGRPMDEASAHTTP